MSRHIQVSIDERVCTITFDRPEKKNAFTPEMYEAAADALTDAEADPAVRVVLFRGAGGTFTAGNDVSGFGAERPPRIEDSPAFRFIFGLADFTKPMVAAVDGYAVGVGATMLLHADLVYAAEGARIRFPFVDLGLVPEAGSSFLLPQLIGRQRAAELLLLCDDLDAQSAHRLGLVSAVFTGDTLHDAAAERARRLAHKAPESLRRTRALMRGIDKDTLRAIMVRELEVFAECLRGPEAKEAVSAFAERRRPDFSQFD